MQTQTRKSSSGDERHLMSSDATECNEKTIKLTKTLGGVSNIQEILEEASQEMN